MSSVFRTIFVTKNTNRERLEYGAYTFGCFLVALFGIGWVMYLGHW